MSAVQCREVYIPDPVSSWCLPSVCFVLWHCGPGSGVAPSGLCGGQAAQYQLGLWLGNSLTESAFYYAQLASPTLHQQGSILDKKSDGSAMGACGATSQVLSLPGGPMLLRAQSTGWEKSIGSLSQAPFNGSRIGHYGGNPLLWVHFSLLEILLLRSVAAGAGECFEALELSLSLSSSSLSAIPHS